MKMCCVSLKIFEIITIEFTLLILSVKYCELALSFMSFFGLASSMLASAERKTQQYDNVLYIWEFVLCYSIYSALRNPIKPEMTQRLSLYSRFTLFALHFSTI